MPEKGLFRRVREVITGHFNTHPANADPDEKYRRELFRREYYAGVAKSIPGGMPVMDEKRVGKILNMTPEELRFEREKEQSSPQTQA